MKDPRQMTFNELKMWLRDHLQMRGVAAAEISTRVEEAPYEQPALLWKSGEDDFRTTFTRAVLDLVAEAGTEPWEPTHFHELGSLLEATGLWEAIRPLEDIAHSKRLLQRNSGPQLHMIALRTLLALGWNGTPDFWFGQKELVGERWPGIIFEGFARHDPDLAFGQLPELITTREAMRQILDLFPGLMRDLKMGISTLRDQSRTVVGRLNPEVAEAMRHWFRLRNYPLDARVGATNVTLLTALRIILAEESDPRVRSPMLCARFDNGCGIA